LPKPIFTPVYYKRPVIVKIPKEEPESPVVVIYPVFKKREKYVPLPDTPVRRAPKKIIKKKIYKK